MTSSIDVSSLRERARSAAWEGDLEGAEEALRSAALRALGTRREYREILRELEDVLTRKVDARGALTVIACVASEDPAAWARTRPWLARVPAIDRAMVALGEGRFAEAAQQMEDAGRVAAAAIHREQTQDWKTARALWSRLARAPEVKDAYVTALVHFNLARCARRCDDTAQAREAAVTCVRLLEEAADHFESIGQRERAFDCFQVLIEVGRDAGPFEDVLEGFVNSIRILREDHLRTFALESFDEAIAAAEQRGETTAAATFAREAAEYARGLGSEAIARGHMLRQAELWQRAAREQAGRGAPVDLVANALLAAIVAFADAGQYARAGALYHDAALLDLDPKRREHYARAARRYAGVADEPINRPPPQAQASKASGTPAEIWLADVIEWEQRGSAGEACAQVMLDKRAPELVRRRAMSARLASLRAEAHGDDRRPAAVGERVQLAGLLAQLQHYAVLSPLEAMFAGSERPVKIAVVDAMQTLLYKRTFVTLRTALRDDDSALAAHAAKTIEALHFPHAFDPLSRIFRESSAPIARAAALRALARIDTQESAEFLLGVLEHGASADRAAALAAVRAAPASKFMQLARESLARASGPLEASLREALAPR